MILCHDLWIFLDFCHYLSLLGASMVLCSKLEIVHKTSFKTKLNALFRLTILSLVLTVKLCSFWWCAALVSLYIIYFCLCMFPMFKVVSFLYRHWSEKVRYINLLFTICFANSNTNPFSGFWCVIVSTAFPKHICISNINWPLFILATSKCLSIAAGICSIVACLRYSD